MSGATITGRMTGYKEMERGLRDRSRLVRAHTRKRLEFWGRRLITSIRGDDGLFSSGKGRLQRSLWTRPVKGAPQPAQAIGWAVPYGEVLEFGPAFKRVWKIKPKGFRSDISHGRSGGGVALSRLRFVARGKVVYAKEVTHHWTEKERRPHFAPWLDHQRRYFLEDLLSVESRVIAGELT